MRVIGVCAVLAIGAVGCEESGSSTAGGAPAYQGEAQSQLGRTAEMGRNLADQIGARDAQIGSAAGAAMGGLASVPGLEFSSPEGWTAREPGNSMRLAEFDADGATVTVSQAGGTVAANIDRWLGQVVDSGEQPAEPVSRETRSVAGLSTTVVETYGTYLEGGMMGTPTRNAGYGLVGAVIETPGSLTFVKMTGPEDIVESQRTVFDRFLDGMRRP
ncbi:MAG: hypothetical protein AAGF47_11585 [Planctomycetota bacterium]